MTDNPLFALGPSTDAVGSAALAFGVVLFGLGVARPALLRRWLMRGSPTRFLGVCAALAFLLSWGYVAYFLRGGPRIVDATSYFLEARALAEGHLAFAIPEPTAAFRGRFTLLGPHGLSVLFPPGYPLLLALGFRLGAPMLIGPALAAALVVVTYVTAKELELGEAVARVATVTSLLCAALRYHTADTMSHGLSALLLAASMAAAARPSLVRALLSGLCAGWLVSTRPMSGGVAVMLVCWLLASRSTGHARWLRPLAALVALAPGVGLLMAHQAAATGSPWQSTQLAYYDVADGPLGCFRWGFGENVGCRFEHGDFVKRRLVGGFGPLQALLVSAERLMWHAFDLANFAPLALVLPWIAWRRRGEPAVRCLATAALLVSLAYLPFYYPGSYPGGGARLLSDGLPLEHVLLAVALVELRAEVLLPALAALGFGLNTVHAHLALRDREGGRPMFEPRVLAEQGRRSGLIWVKTDHGFALGHDPSARDPKTELVVARGRGDAHDLALWARLGSPAAATYEYSPRTGQASLVDWHPPPGRWRWEAEAEWPPRQVLGATWAHPDFRPCLSAGQGLHLRPSPEGITVIELGAPEEATRQVMLGWMADAGAQLTIVLPYREVAVTHRGSGCEETDLGEFDLSRTNKATFVTRDPVILDYLEVAPPGAGPTSK